MTQNQFNFRMAYRTIKPNLKNTLLRVTEGHEAL